MSIEGWNFINPPVDGGEPVPGSGSGTGYPPEDGDSHEGPSPRIKPQPPFERSLLDDPPQLSSLAKMVQAELAKGAKAERAPANLDYLIEKRMAEFEKRLEAKIEAALSQLAPPRKRRVGW